MLIASLSVAVLCASWLWLNIQPAPGRSNKTPAYSIGQPTKFLSSEYTLSDGVKSPISTPSFSPVPSRWPSFSPHLYSKCLRHNASNAESPFPLSFPPLFPSLNANQWRTSGKHSSYLVQFLHYDTQASLFSLLSTEFKRVSMAQWHPFSHFFNLHLPFSFVSRRSKLIRDSIPTDFISVQLHSSPFLDPFLDYFFNYIQQEARSFNHHHIKRIVPDLKITQSALQYENLSKLKRRNRQLTEQKSIELNLNKEPPASTVDIPVVKHSSDNANDRNSPVHLLHVDQFWEKGYTGKKINIGIFDTGLSHHVFPPSDIDVFTERHFFSNIPEVSTYTDDNPSTYHDDLGHGTFVASIIAANALPEQKKTCPSHIGISPDSSLSIFKVFTKYQVSYTSWFLDAFNYALQSNIHILNLSIGGPDYMDEPFIDKVQELVSHGIIFVSAIGNDGPLYGTLNNPADMPSVIGVGGLNLKEEIASFSSRGATTLNLRHGYGRVKPDLVTLSEDVPGLHKKGASCQTLSGTSVASPIVAGVVALLSSALSEKDRFPYLNPGSVKQVLHESSVRLPKSNIYEQGAGKLDLQRAYTSLIEYTPRITFFPSKLDLTDCPYMSPHCEQEMYYSGMPMVLNATIINGVSVSAKIRECYLIPYDEDDHSSQVLDVTFNYDEVIWPYSGWLGIKLSVNHFGQAFEGTATGIIRCKFKIHATANNYHSPNGLYIVDLPLQVNVIKPPPRERRILWDQYHSLQYPPGYIPRDDLSVEDDILDWNGDHIHTNFRDFFLYLREHKFYVEILNGDLTSFDPKNYGCLLIVDPEEEFSLDERDALQNAVNDFGMGLFVFADWYNNEVLEKIIFLDENTKTKWVPITGGANIPALNGLLDPFSITFGDKIYDGSFRFGSFSGRFASGTSIVRFPSRTLLGFARILKDQTVSLLTNRHVSQYNVPIFGITQSGEGRIAVFGDSNCLDSSHRSSDEQCFDFAESIMRFVSKVTVSPDRSIRKDMQFIDDEHGFLASGASVPIPTELIDEHSNVAPEDRARGTPLNTTVLWNQLHQKRLQRSFWIRFEQSGGMGLFLFAVVCILAAGLMVYTALSRSKTWVTEENSDDLHV